MKKLKTRMGEIEVVTYDRDGLELITFNSLKNAVSQMEGVEIGKPIFETTEPHISCSIPLNFNGKTFWGFGESSPQTLAEGIDRDYPLTTARNRAMSDAIILFLGLCDGKHYSTAQITKEAKEASNEPKEAATPSKASEAEKALAYQLKVGKYKGLTWKEVFAKGDGYKAWVEHMEKAPRLNAAASEALATLKLIPAELRIAG